ncbi:glycosyl hydrolase 9B9 [Medicago truncatula]|uniref:Glycosyl hydrolase 9B9 n=1 Tax=Medicago truncatula TaxID=3880 RepID=G7JVY0_MEDTR|nr:glycosyl hydrolase 9B9 [Medicago truncatula]
MFSWDDKYVGAQILAAKLVLDATVESSGIWAQYKANAEQFICSCPWGNIIINVSTATFAMFIYSQYLSPKQASLQCSDGVLSPSDLTSLVQAQVIQP